MKTKEQWNAYMREYRKKRRVSDPEWARKQSIASYAYVKRTKQEIAIMREERRVDEQHSTQ